MPDHLQDPTAHIDEHRMPRKGDYLEIGLSPPLHMQYLTETTSYQDRKDKFHAYWVKRFNTTLKGADTYTLHLEQGLGGMLHYHGIIKVNDPETLLDSILRLKTGTITKKKYTSEDAIRVTLYRVKDEKHLKERQKYCTKDHTIMKYTIRTKNDVLKRMTF